MDPLDILLPELWELIFERVEDPQDWLNLYRTSSTFEGVVGDERPRALLSQVFPLVYKHLDGSQGGVLPLRLVSRKWKEAVDKILESKEADTVFFEAYKYRLYEFEDSARISSFLDKFETHPGNPFIGSFLSFSFDSEDKTEEMMANYQAMVTRLMGRFGMHIKNLDFDTTDTNLDNVLRQLRSCIELAPNLEKLSVVMIDPDIEFEYQAAANPDLGNLPSPILSKLQWFSFDTGMTSKELTDLQDIIIQMCCNPETLTSAKIVGVAPALSTTFPNLEKIALSIIPTEEHESNLINYSFPLPRLTLRQLDFDYITLSSVVKYANHFKDTLVSLKIDCHWEATEEDSELRLDLPHLKRLTFPFLSLPRLKGSAFSLVENLSNLEELRVSQPPYRHSDPNFQVFKLFTHIIEAEMSKFHVWDKFPKLEKLKLTGFQGIEARFKVYYREN